MTGFRTVASVGQVWLTALITLVSGIPVVECRCSREVPLASGRVATAPACCCGGKCCASTESTGCCHAPVREIQEPALVPHDGLKAPGNNQGELRGSQCVQALAQPQSYSPAPARTFAGNDTTPGAHLPSLLVTIAVVPATMDGQSRWGGQPLAPPPDLVTLHQHFLI